MEHHTKDRRADHSGWKNEISNNYSNLEIAGLNTILPDYPQASAYVVCSQRYLDRNLQET